MFLTVTTHNHLTILATNPPTHAPPSTSPPLVQRRLQPLSPRRNHPPPPASRPSPPLLPPPSPARPLVMGEVSVGDPSPPRPARPTMTDESALRRHLQATVLARKLPSPFHSPMHYTFMPHQASSRPAQPLAPLIPTPQILIHSPLVPHKLFLPVSQHIPMRKLSFIHIQMIQYLFHQLLPSAPITR